MHEQLEHETNGAMLIKDGIKEQANKKY